MDYGWMNLGSLLLGLLAWVLPLREWTRRLNGGEERPLSGIGSAVCCALSLLLQLLYGRHLVEIRDWSALMDTAGAVTVVAGILVAVTILLNLPLCIKGVFTDRENEHGPV